MIIVKLQMGFDSAIKYLNGDVFVFLFLAHSRGIVVSDSLYQYHSLNKVVGFDFRSLSYACGLCNILRGKIFHIFHSSLFLAMGKCCILCVLSFQNTLHFSN